MNARGSLIVAREGLVWLRKAEEARKDVDWTPKILITSPPIYRRFFRGKVPYAMTKVRITCSLYEYSIQMQRLLLRFP